MILAAVRTPAATTVARLCLAASINTPAGVVATSPAIPPRTTMALITPRLSRGQRAAPRKKAGSGVHVSHEEIHRQQRGTITRPRLRR